MKHSYLILTLSVCMVACQPSNKSETQEEATKQVELTKVWESDTTLTTPESVLYNSDEQVLYVSCIGGVPPDSKDEDGFIAKISAKDGSVIERQWVTGLSAPKGMALYEDKLYVTDIDRLVEIDISTGEIANTYPVENAMFLNDLTVGPDGNVYASDSYTNKILVLSGNEVNVWLEDSTMGNPNGLLYDEDRLMMATFGSGTFNAIGLQDKRMDQVADSIPGGDGVVKVGDDYFVSNWNGEVYYVTDQETQKILDTKDAGANAADIEYISQDSLLLVPTFFGNQVVAYRLEK